MSRVVYNYIIESNKKNKCAAGEKIYKTIKKKKHYDPRTVHARYILNYFYGNMTMYLFALFYSRTCYTIAN